MWTRRQKPGRLGRVYYGWWVVAVAFVINALVSAVYYVGFSVFFLPFSRDLKIDRTAASLPSSLAWAVSSLTSPLAGLAADRLGPAKILFASGLAAGIGYVLLSWSRTYWALALSFGLRGTVWSAFSVHLVAMMVWKSIKESTAGLLLGAYPLFWIPSTLVMGWLADMWSKRRIAGYGGLIGALGLLLLAVWDRTSVWQMLLIFVLLAPNDGAWPLAWAMLSDEFGRRNFGAIRGGILSVESLMGIGGPIYAGWVFETTQSYFWVALPGAALLVAAGLLNLFMPHARPRSPARASEGKLG